MNLLTCPSCGSSFRSSEVDPSLGIATCGACGTVVDLRTRAAATNDRLDALTRPPPPRPAVPLPEAFQVDERDGRFSVTWRWRKLESVVPFAFMAVFWNAIVLTSLFSWKGKQWSGDATFHLLFAALGVHLVYTAVTRLFNSTTITLEHGVLRVKHGPIPALGGGAWQRDDLAQLYAEEIVQLRRNRAESHTYDLNAMLRDGRRVKLIKGLKDKGQVRWLERTLETRMDIVDIEVEGELAKR